MAADTSDPARFVRFIYNRVILENATVRAAATTALATICSRCEPLRERIIIILKRSLADSDDEVRDRCTLYLAHLQRDAGTPAMVTPALDVPLANLEKELRGYLAGPMDADFVIDAVDKEVEEPIVPVYAFCSFVASPRHFGVSFWVLLRTAVSLHLLFSFILDI
jgi:coatomer subunit gamma